MVYKLFDKKKGSGGNLHQPHFRSRISPTSDKKFKKRKASARFKDNIWGADLAEMDSLSSFNGGVRYLLCVIYVFTKYAWIKPLKGKKDKTVRHGFNEIVNESKS